MEKSFGRMVLDYSLELFCAIVILLTLIRILFFPELSLIHNLVSAFALTAVLHEFEEKRTPGGFMELMQKAGGVDMAKLDTGLAASFVMIYWVVLLGLSFAFPNLMFFFVMLVCLGIFEAFVHTMAIFVGRIGKPYSPGLVSAWVMCALSIYSIVALNSSELVTGFDWGIGIVLFFFSFVILQRSTLFAARMTYRDFLTNVRNHALGRS